MPQAPAQYQPANPQPHPGMGFREQPNPIWEAIESLVKGMRGMNMSSNQPPPWGMHEPTLTAASAVGPAMQGAGDVMADPRNTWLGLGTIGPITRFGQGIRGAAKGIPEMGGHSVPTATMRQQMGIPRPNLRAGEAPGLDNVRQSFMDMAQGNTEVAKILNDNTHPLHMQFLKRYQGLPSGDRADLKKSMDGMTDLANEMSLRKNSISGGGIPPHWLDPKNLK